MPDSPYSAQLRIRVNGLLVKDDALLMVRLHSPVTNSMVWMPPGGGLEFGESMESCLQREFTEETGLEIEVGALRHVNELLEPPFHALEFYFDVIPQNEQLPKLGSDPEHEDNQQLLQEVSFIPFTDFSALTIAPEFLSGSFLEELGGDGKSLTYSGSGS